MIWRADVRYQGVLVDLTNAFQEGAVDDHRSASGFYLHNGALTNKSVFESLRLE